MERESREGQVPPGSCRRIALVVEACCKACDDRTTFTVSTNSREQELRRRGWGIRKKKWHCARCMGREMPEETMLRLVKEADDA